MTQKLIEQKEEEKKALINRMEDQKEAFLKELVDFVPIWIERETKTTVKESADKVVELGEEKARDLKNRVKELTDSSNDLVQEYMREDNVWWHLKEDNASYYSYDHRLLEKLDNQIKKMFGELGAIFLEFGVAKVSSIYQSGYSNRWSKHHDNQISYTYFIDYSEKMLEINKQYAKMISEGQKLNRELKGLKDTLKKENAEDWWDSL